MSIWSCVETDAWSRGFNYEGYIQYHEACYKNIREVPAVLSERAWNAFSTLMQNELNSYTEKTETPLL